MNPLNYYVNTKLFKKKCITRFDCNILTRTATFLDLEYNHKYTKKFITKFECNISVKTAISLRKFECRIK